MALTVTTPTATVAVSGLKFFLGKLTGTYGGAWTTMTVPMSGTYFVHIPPVSNYVFAYNVATTVFAMIVGGASASNSVLATSPTSVDLSSFNCVFNNEATVGVPFVAFGY
jgi:hypothetical protein